MAKVKGGLGKSSFIEDLTKPISFHISESLEPPPEFNRRKTAPREIPRELLEPEEKSLPQLILEKIAAMMEGEGIQVAFHLECSNDSLLLESATNSPGLDWRITSVRGSEGEYREVSWKDSTFSGLEGRDVIELQAGKISSVEVMTDDDFINFSSMDDFFEWLEIR